MYVGTNWILWQCCEAYRVSKYNVFVYLVDRWILLGNCWRSNFDNWFASALLVCVVKSIFLWFFYYLSAYLYFYCLWMGLFCRLCITFLAFDVVFVVICIAVACLVGIAVCCCLPCIITILYVVTDQVDTHEFLVRQFSLICSYYGSETVELLVGMNSQSTWSTLIVTMLVWLYSKIFCHVLF